MSGVNKYYIELETNVRQTLADVKSLQDRMDKLEGKEHKLDIGIDTEKLEKVISNLDKMLNSLGKGTGDFKQFEKLSKQLQEAKGNIDGLKKSLGTLNADKGMKNILTAINSIDSSLTTLTTNLKGITSINTGGVEKEIKDLASAGDKAADSMERAAQARKKLAETDLSSGGSKSASATDNKSKSNTEYLKNVQTALTETKKRLSELKGKDLTDLEKPFSDISSKVTELNEKLQNGEITLKQYQSAVNSAFSGYDKELSNVTSNIEKMVTKSSNFVGKIDTKKNNVFPSEKYKALVKESNDLLDKMKNIQTEIKNQNGIASQEQLNQLGQYNKRIEEIYNATKKMTTSEKGSTEGKAIKEIKKIYEALDKNTRMSSEAKAQLHSYINELKTNPSANVEEIAAAWKKVIVAEKEAGRGGKSLLSAVGEKAFYGLAGQIAGMVSLLDVINVGKQGIGVVKDLDTALTEMRKVSDETLQSLKNYQATTFDTANSIGTTAEQLQQSTADWMRLGESMDSAAKSAKAANVLLNVSEFDSIDDATEALVSMSQAYKDLDKMDIVDIANNIGNNYSISTDGLATALQESASALVTANNDINEAAAIITAGNAITQDPASVGNGARTIALRLVGTEEAKKELSDLGEETDGMVTTVSKLRDTIKSATAAATADGKGFDILDENGNYKSTYEIMQGLADLYDDIVAKDKELGTNNLNLLLETIAGKNRSNIAASILQNGKMLRSVYEDAQHSKGSAEKENQAYLDSLDGRLQLLQNRAQEFWYNVINSDALKTIVSGATSVLEVVDKIVDKIGILPAILTGGGIFAFFKDFRSPE